MKKFIPFLALAIMLCLSACGNDEPETTPAPQTFTGQFVTSIPAVPDFQPITTQNEITVNWLNPEQTQATIVVGAFSISINQHAQPFEIGEMTITGVTCEKGSNGIISLRADNFNCMAGEFDTTGSVRGEIRDGNLSLTFEYTPGSMPLQVVSVFNGR